MLVALMLAAFGVSQMETTASPDLTTWIVVLGIQAVPYACALIVSMASALSLPSWLVGTTYRAVGGSAGAVTTAVAEASRQAAEPVAAPAADPAAATGASASSLQPALAPAAAVVMAAAAVGGVLSADQIGGNNSLGGADPAFISGSLSKRSIGNV
jgi:hypothetical protein